MLNTARASRLDWRPCRSTFGLLQLAFAAAPGPFRVSRQRFQPGQTSAPVISVGMQLTRLSANWGWYRQAGSVSFRYDHRYRTPADAIWSTCALSVSGENW